MATPVHPAAVHGILGTPRRMIIALAIVVVALAAAVITTVVLLQSGTTAPAVVNDEPASVGGSAPEWLQDYSFGSADSLERAG
jgi:uncharacterized membrane protein